MQKKGRSYRQIVLLSLTVLTSSGRGQVSRNGERRLRPIDDFLVRIHYEKFTEVRHHEG